MSGSTIRRNVNRGKTCARGEREGGRDVEETRMKGKA